MLSPDNKLAVRCAIVGRSRRSRSDPRSQTADTRPAVAAFARRTGPEHATIYVKAEFFNPAASVKDRLALAIIEHGERTGKLKPGQTVVEATSGNTGVGLAMVCAAKGYPLVITMAESFSIERRKLMRYLGAKVVLTPKAEKGMGMVRKAQELAKENGWFLASQFETAANADIHEHTTAREILADFEGRRLSVGSAGSGTEQFSRQLLAAYDLTYDDLDERFLTFTESAQALGDASIDGAVFSVGYPASAALQAISTAGARLIPVDSAHVERLRAEHPYYELGVIPAGAYPGLERDVPTVAMLNWIVARADLEDEVVRSVLNVLDQRRKQLVATTDIARQIDLGRLSDAPIPVHPAAEASRKIRICFPTCAMRSPSAPAAMPSRPPRWPPPSKRCRPRSRTPRSMRRTRPRWPSRRRRSRPRAPTWCRRRPKG